MLMKKITLLFFLATIVFSSCSKTPDSNGVEMIIGVFYGECLGDCATMYQLRNDMIYPDIIEDGYSESPEFSNNSLELEESMIQDFKNLETLIPTSLLENDVTSYGCPDCGDWGAIVFSLNGRFWTLDNSVENNPEEIQSFVIEIQELLQQLST
jgi:hypothetical protein